MWLCFGRGYHYDAMSIMTLHQDANTVELLHCWKYVSQSESFHDTVSRVTSCVRTKVSFIHQRRRDCRTIAIVTYVFPFFVLTFAYQRQAVQRTRSCSLWQIESQRGLSRLPRTLYLQHFGFFIWLVPVEFENSTQAPLHDGLLHPASPVSLNRNFPSQQYVSLHDSRPPFHFHGNCASVCQLCRSQHQSCRSTKTTTNINAATSYDTDPGQEAK